jgi:hypothetical protein
MGKGEKRTPEFILKEVRFLLYRPTHYQNLNLNNRLVTCYGYQTFSICYRTFKSETE